MKMKKMMKRILTNKMENKQIGVIAKSYSKRLKVKVINKINNKFKKQTHRIKIMKMRNNKMKKNKINNNKMIKININSYNSNNWRNLRCKINRNLSKNQKRLEIKIKINQKKMIKIKNKNNYWMTKS